MSEFSTEIAKSLEFNNPGPLDKNRGPYATKEIACQKIPNIWKVIDGVNRNFREGKIVDIGIFPNTVEYRWIGGYSNEDLHPYNDIEFKDPDNLYNRETNVYGKELRGSTEVVRANEVYTTFACVPFQKITVSNLPPDSANHRYYYWFDKNDVYLGIDGYIPKGSVSGILTPPEGAHHGKINIIGNNALGLSQTGNIKIEVGEIATPLKERLTKINGRDIFLTSLEWEPDYYSAKFEVVCNGRLFLSSSRTTPLDVPGKSPLWVERFSGYAVKPETKIIYNFETLYK